MARETFISYKYSEAQTLRDKIVTALGKDAVYYKGETSESPDISNTSVDNIKNNLKNMIFGTSVTIVIVSPAMIRSKWIDWEIEYSLKEYKRNSTTSRTNGIVCVVMKVNGNYDWIFSTEHHFDGCSSRITQNKYLYEIIKNNRFNLSSDDKYSCPQCKTSDRLSGSYISLIEEDDFLINPSFYIENAHAKSQNLTSYNLHKQR